MYSQSVTFRFFCLLVATNLSFVDVVHPEILWLQLGSGSKRHILSQARQWKARLGVGNDRHDSHIAPCNWYFALASLPHNDQKTLVRTKDLNLLVARTDPSHTLS